MYELNYHCNSEAVGLIEKDHVALEQFNNFIDKIVGQRLKVCSWMFVRGHNVICVSDWACLCVIHNIAFIIEGDSSITTNAISCSLSVNYGSVY